jgi:hypothetical protein
MPSSLLRVRQLMQKVAVEPAAQNPTQAFNLLGELAKMTGLEWLGPLSALFMGQNVLDPNTQDIRVKQALAKINQQNLMYAKGIQGPLAERTKQWTNKVAQSIAKNYGGITDPAQLAQISTNPFHVANIAALALSMAPDVNLPGVVQELNKIIVPELVQGTGRTAQDQANRAQRTSQFIDTAFRFIAGNRTGRDRINIDNVSLARFLTGRARQGMFSDIIDTAPGASFNQAMQDRLMKVGGLAETAYKFSPDGDIENGFKVIQQYLGPEAFQDFNQLDKVTKALNRVTQLSEMTGKNGHEILATLGSAYREGGLPIENALGLTENMLSFTRTGQMMGLNMEGDATTKSLMDTLQGIPSSDYAIALGVAGALGEKQFGQKLSMQKINNVLKQKGVLESPATLARALRSAGFNIPQSDKEVRAIYSTDPRAASIAASPHVARIGLQVQSERIGKTIKDTLGYSTMSDLDKTYLDKVLASEKDPTKALNKFINTRSNLRTPGEKAMALQTYTQQIEGSLGGSLKGNWGVYKLGSPRGIDQHRLTTQEADYPEKVRNDMPDAPPPGIRGVAQGHFAGTSQGLLPDFLQGLGLNTIFPQPTPDPVKKG